MAQRLRFFHAPGSEGIGADLAGGEDAVTAQSSSRPTRCKHVVLSDVRYEISVSSFEQNHRAKWRCDKCGETGAWAPIGETPEAAIELAIIALQIHHSLVHGDPRWPPKCA